MKFNFLFKSFLLGVITLFIVSCDKEFTDIGADILNDDHYALESITSDVVAYNQNLGVVQSNNLPINSLGVYDNPVFGKTTASFVSQLNVAVSTPVFYDKPTITVDSVYLYIPYFSTFVSTDVASGDSTYTIDSIQKNNANLASNKIKLSIYESNYFLRDFDSNSNLNQPQKYFSDMQSDFDNNLGNGGARLNDDADASQNDQFEFKATQIKFYKNDPTTGAPATTTVRERLAPGIFIMLNKEFFKNKIINAPAGKLLNNNAFREYFRGLYFKAENAAGSPDNGALAKLNFAQGRITIIYKDQISATNTIKEKKSIVLNLGGNTVNVFSNPWVNPVATPNTTIGDDKLYIKGGAGSMAIIDLFGGATNDNAVTLNQLRSMNALVNDAYIVFNVDKPTLGTAAPEPNRILLYDFTNRRPLIDYYFDGTTATNTKYSKFVHGGILIDDNSKIVNASKGERGTKYKIRITNHIKNLLQFGGADVAKDSTNVRLGLVVTEAINTVTTASLKNPFTIGGFTNKFTPVMSVVNPLGTVLYGTGANVPAAQKIKLEIFYTKPE